MEAGTETPDYDGQIKAPPPVIDYVVVLIDIFAPSQVIGSWRYDEKFRYFNGEAAGGRFLISLQASAEPHVSNSLRSGEQGPHVR